MSRPHSKEPSPPDSQPVPTRPLRQEFPSPTLPLKLLLRASSDSPLLLRLPHPSRPRHSATYRSYLVPSSASFPFLPPARAPTSPPAAGPAASLATKSAFSLFLIRRLPLSPAPSLPPTRLRPGPGDSSRTHRTRRCTRSPRSFPRTSPA